jgi:Putative inner membrane protein (DUF1819)
VDMDARSTEDALRVVRDNGAPSSRGTAKSGLLKESFAVFRAMANGLAATEVRSAILEGKLFQKTSISTRISIWMALRHRYFSVDPLVSRSLAAASSSGFDSLEFRSLAYLYWALRDRVVFEFVTGPIWEHWQSASVTISREDFLAFVDRLSEEHPSIKHWRESTRIRLCQNVLTALRDFGLLRGIQKKSVQQPGVALETLFHLLALLWAEGTKGAAIIAAPSWRLFFLSETQVAEHLAQMARNGWIRFERSGRVVILEMRRTLEIR